jgi:hypothetical protein
MHFEQYFSMRCPPGSPGRGLPGSADARSTSASRPDSELDCPSTRCLIVCPRLQRLPRAGGDQATTARRSSAPGSCERRRSQLRTSPMNAAGYARGMVAPTGRGPPSVSRNEESAQVSRDILGPKSARAKNRTRDHTLEVVRRGVLDGVPAVLTRCTDRKCPNIVKDGAAWSGWFTQSEIEVRDPRN